MPKLKTNRAAAKRFRKTASGGMKRKRAFRRHLLTAKSRKRKRHLRGTARLQPGDLRNVRELLPN